MELVFLACLAFSPDNCHHERIQASVAPMSQFACLQQAQPTIAQWSAEHPHFRIENYRCEVITSGSGEG